MIILAKQRKLAVHEMWKRPKDDDDKILDNFKDEHAFHKTIRDRLDQGEGPLATGQPDILSNEATRFVILMFGKSPDDISSVSLKDVMGEYYFYLEKYDKKYLKSLSNIVSELKRHPDNLKQQIDLGKMVPQARPGAVPSAVPGAATGVAPDASNGFDLGLGGVPLGTTSSNNKRLITGRLFLKRPNKKHVMSDTLLGRILCGNVHLVRPNGDTVILILKDDEVSVPKSSAAASLAVKIEEELPSVILSTISKFIRERDLPDADFMARTITEGFSKNGSLDLRPISILIGGNALGIMLYEDVIGVLEPEDVQELREKIGKSMSPLVDSLKSALSMEGIDVVEREVKMPEHTRSGRQHASGGTRHMDRHPTRDPATLSRDKLVKSLDVPSIIMTSSDRNQDPELRGMAIDRLVEIIVSSPETYKKNRLSIEDMHYLGKSANNEVLGPRLERLIKFIELFDADDDFVLREYLKATSSDKKLISTLVSKQDRQEIIDANPSMAIAGETLNSDFLSKMNPANEQVIVFLIQLIGLRNSGQLRSHRILDNKVAEAIYVSSDKTLIAQALRSRSSLPYLAMSVLLERGDERDQSSAVKYLGKLPMGLCVSEYVKTLLASSFAEAMGDNVEVMKLVKKVLDVSPEKIANLSGKTLGIEFMRSIKSDWNGDEVPEAGKLFSLSEDPLSLAKSYKQLADAGDSGARAGLHRLMHLLSQKLSEDDNEDLRYALDYVREALTGIGEDRSFLDAFSQKNKQIEAKLLPNGSLLVKKSGRYFIDDFSVCFSSGPDMCELIAIQEMAKARKNPSGSVSY